MWTLVEPIHAVTQLGPRMVELATPLAAAHPALPPVNPIGPPVR